LLGRLIEFTRWIDVPENELPELTPPNSAGNISLFRLIVECLTFLQLYSWTFEWLHERLLHRCRYLRPFHDLHHMTRANCALTAMFMHPVDMLLEIAIPTTVPFLVYPMSAAGASAALICVAVHGCITHSGYHGWPTLWADTKTHILHHLVCFVGGGGSNNDATTAATTAAVESNTKTGRQHSYNLRLVRKSNRAHVLQ
jgi:sterol desaturase/sphingolipid hydroxylase (fatty acid hydroxylase superfamily)